MTVTSPIASLERTDEGGTTLASKLPGHLSSFFMRFGQHYGRRAPGGWISRPSELSSTTHPASLEPRASTSGGALDQPAPLRSSTGGGTVSDTEVGDETDAAGEDESGGE